MTSRRIRSNRRLLLRRGLARSWRLFAQSRIGPVGLGIIAVFGLLAITHPILRATVWSDANDGVANVDVYHPVVGSDPIVVDKTIVPDGVEYDPLTEIPMTEARAVGGMFLDVGDSLPVPQSPAPPSSRHLLGTDPHGRDVLSQLMFGARNAFILGLVAALVSTVLATIVGSLAAYHGGIVDAYLMRQADLVLMLPLVPLLIVTAAFWDVGLFGVALLFGLIEGLGGTALLLKSQALAVTVRPFVEAGRVAGGSAWQVIQRHVIPNVLPLSFLYMMFDVTVAIQAEATLSFFGLLDIEMSWGAMINTAHSQGYTLSGIKFWWLLLPAGLSVTLLAFGFFLVGRGLDEVVDPRLRAR